MAIEKHRELTATEIDLVAGGRKLKELKEELKELQEELKQSDPGNKGFGGANSLA